MTRKLAQIDAFITKLPPAVQEALARISSRHSFKKGDYLLRAGDVCRYSYLIETGLARKYYLIDGREVTTEIYFPQDLALSLTSHTLQLPSLEVIQVLENTIASRTDYQAFEQLKQEFPILVELDLRLTEYYALWQEDRLRQFRTLDATQRYELLLITQPHWMQHLQLTHIASYLGISLETLSRIRARRAALPNHPTGANLM